MVNTWPGYLQQVKAELDSALSVEAAIENMPRSYPTRCIHIVNNGKWETHLIVHGLLWILISIRSQAR